MTMFPTLPHDADTGAADERIHARRTFLRTGVMALAAHTILGRSVAAALMIPRGLEEVSIENFSASGKSQDVVRVPKVVKTDAEWRKLLTPDSYRITRQEGTEFAFSGKYADYHGDGLYRCICCGTALYDSKTKFESGTGWPSFWEPISDINTVKKTDRGFGMVRDAISCRRCDAHLGHVFDDGPKPTGLRYCMNSVALQFVARG